MCNIYHLIIFIRTLSLCVGVTIFCPQLTPKLTDDSFSNQLLDNSISYFLCLAYCFFLSFLRGMSLKSFKTHMNSYCSTKTFHLLHVFILVIFLAILFCYVSQLPLSYKCQLIKTYGLYQRHFTNNTWQVTNILNLI